MIEVDLKLKTRFNEAKIQYCIRSHFKKRGKKKLKKKKKTTTTNKTSKHQKRSFKILKQNYSEINYYVLDESPT